jgi:hypothetical protein
MSRLDDPALGSASAGNPRRVGHSLQYRTSSQCVGAGRARSATTCNGVAEVQIPLSARGGRVRARRISARRPASRILARACVKIPDTDTCGAQPDLGNILGNIFFPSLPLSQPQSRRYTTESDGFLIRRVVVPRRFDSIPDSTRLSAAQSAMHNFGLLASSTFQRSARFDA